MVRTEAKKDAFRRLATQRTNAVINRLRILGHCSNPQLYDYTQEDVKKMFRAIESEMKATKAKFINSSKSEFQL